MNSACFPTKKKKKSKWNSCPFTFADLIINVVLEFLTFCIFFLVLERLLANYRKLEAIEEIWRWRRSWESWLWSYCSVVIHFWVFSFRLFSKNVFKIHWWHTSLPCVFVRWCNKVTLSNDNKCFINIMLIACIILCHTGMSRFSCVECFPVGPSSCVLSISHRWK